MNVSSKLRNASVLLVMLFLSAPQLSAGTIAETIDSLLADKVLAHGIQGVVVESLKDDRVLYERNRDLVFIPASNMKLIVSAAALDRLGPDFTYQTTLWRTGPLQDGVLVGDLVLKGSGDPIFSLADLKTMVVELKKAGVKRVTGRVLGDDTRFDDVRLGWGWNWDDEPYYYSAQLSALSLNESVVGVCVKPGNLGDRPKIVLDPPTSYMSIRNDATTGPAKSDKTISIDRLRGRNIIRVSGSVPVDYRSDQPEELITVEEPAVFAATVLKEMLVRDGIWVAGEAARGQAPAGAVQIASHTSPPLKVILARLNKPSDNLIAELLLKTLGAELRGRGTTSAGREVELEFLSEIGVDTEALSIVDGSGLSRLNYVSPGNLVRLLRFMYSHPHAKTYIDSLPVAGVDGTLRRRMNGSPAEKNVRAKTGYVSRVSSLSGYLTTKGGEPLVFSILMNNHLCRNSEATAIQNKICEFLASLE